MHPDLDRLIAEDEMARASVEAAAAAGERRIEAARVGIAAARDRRLRELAQQVDETVDAIRNASERDAALRREHRKAFETERSTAAAATLDEAVALLVSVVRDGAFPRETG